MRRTVKYLAAAFVTAMAVGCSGKYEELPPKTDDHTSNYLLPQGEIPTAEETAIVTALRKEYDNLK